MPKKDNHDTHAFMRVRVFDLYAEGFNFKEIGEKLQISPKHVESNLLSYIRTRQININELEEERSRRTHDRLLEKSQVGSMTFQPAAKPLKAYILPTEKPCLWFCKVKKFFRKVFLFWK